MYVSEGFSGRNLSSLANRHKLPGVLWGIYDRSELFSLAVIGNASGVGSNVVHGLCTRHTSGFARQLSNWIG